MQLGVREVVGVKEAPLLGVADEEEGGSTTPDPDNCRTAFDKVEAACSCCCCWEPLGGRLTVKLTRPSDQDGPPSPVSKEATENERWQMGEIDP